MWHARSICWRTNCKFWKLPFDVIFSLGSKSSSFILGKIKFHYIILTWNSFDISTLVLLRYTQLYGSLHSLSSNPLRNVDISSVRGQCCHNKFTFTILKNSTIKKKNKTFLTLVLQWEGYVRVSLWVESSWDFSGFLRRFLKLTLPVRTVSLDTFILLIVSEC